MVALCTISQSSGPSSGLTEPADYKVICWQIFNFIPSWPADYKVICWQIFSFIPSWIMTTRQASSQTHFLGCYFLNDICVWLRFFFNHQSTLPLLMLDGLMSHLDANLTNLYAPAPASFLWLLVCFLPRISALSSCLCAWLYVLPELCQYGTQEDNEHPHMKACRLLKRAQPTQGNQRTPARR